MAWYVGFVIFLAIFAHFALPRGMNLGGLSGIGFLAASLGAQYWFMREKAEPASGRVWTYALICGAVSSTLVFVLLAAGLVRGDDWELLALFLVFNIFGTRLGFEMFSSNPRILKN